MKKTTLRQVALKLAFVAFVLLAPLGLRAQETLTVCDGTSTNEYVPFYGYYMDTYGTTSEFIIPEDELSDMVGGTISKVTFYISGTPQSWGSPVVQVYLGEAASTTLSSVNGPTGFTVVYTGTVSNQSSTIEITFNNPYTYEGGNLLIGTYVETQGSYKHTYFYGVSAPSGSGYCHYSYSNASQSFLPKTTFEYEPAATGGPTCKKVTGVEVTDITTTSATISWINPVENEGATYYIKQGDNVITTTQGNSYTISNLSSSTTYPAGTFTIVSDCNNGADLKVVNVPAFTTPCDAISTFPWTETFNSLTSGIPNCWDNSEGTTTTESYKWNYYATGHDGAGLRFNSYNNSNNLTNILKTPLMNFPAGQEMQLVFWYKNPTGGDFSVYISTDGGATYTTALATGLTSQSTWKEKEINLTDYVGAENVVIVFNGTSNWGSGDAYIYLDDVTVRQAPSCLAPTGLAATPSTTSAELSWTANSSETAWTIYYKKTTDENYTEVSNVTTNPYTLNGLTPASNYQFYVVANCSANEASYPSETANFPTECEAISTFPWSENFENYTAGNFNANCWVNEHISGSGTQIFKVYTYTNGSNSTHQLQLPDMSNGTQTKLQLPLMTLPNANYQFSIDVLRNASGTSYTSEGVRVFASTNGEIEGATELGFLYRNYTQTNGGVVGAENASGWYTYEFPIPFSGTCYIILRGENQYGSSTYMDNFIVEQIPTCRKPSGLMLETPSAKTAHTATLKWTNGAEGQTAWQIAYSTDANFDPNSVTPIDVTTNPATLVDLAQSTTYYAYVRANCGSEDGMSAWCINKATFATLAGNNAPTGLAVPDITVSSNSATATWNANAANDLHQLYELYLSTDGTTAPATETVPTQTTTETSYTFTGLIPETQYFVWVRDNCGTDGVSTWAGPVDFTTQASCPTPVLNADGITNITAHTADVEWSNYTENTNYEVSYRTAAYYNGETEEFGNDIPTGWARYKGLLNDGGTATLNSTTDGWYFGTANGVFDNHARVNIYGNYQRWLVTPALTVPENGALTFDMALTAFSGALVAPGTSGTDDKFVVLITTDEMATWTVLREWNNSGSEYVYNNIPCSATGENVMIDLGGYVGQPVRIAFYGESTISNADNELHIDNVGVGVAVEAGEWQTQNVTENSLQLTNLVAETPYDVRVKGYCDMTDGGESDIQTFTTTVACPVPTGLDTVGDATTNSVNLTWTAGAVNQDAWQICLNGDETNLLDVTDATVTGTTVTYTLTGLTSGADYSVKVRANCGNVDGVSLQWTNTVNFTTEASCTEPTAFAVVENSVEAHQAQLSWTAGADETAWDIYYSTTATEAPVNGVTEPTVGAITANPYTLAGLDAATTYYVWVRAHCGDAAGQQSPWVGPVTFTTECEAISTFPWNENFNSLTSGIPSCWDNSEGTSGASYKWNYYATGYQGAGLRFNSYNNSNGNTNFLKTPVFNLATGSAMQLSFMYKNPTGGDFSVYISTDGGTTYTTALATGLTGASSWTEETITLDEYLNQENVVFVFKGTSNYGNGDAYIYLDNIVVDVAPACAKPSALMLDNPSARTAHTATLKWTNGAEGQTAWQIAYSTTSDFNPDEVTPVDVTTNPATISGLTQSTTYYAYVRANCGNENGVSNWSVLPANFTTPAGDNAPTGLAVSGITSSTATASWTGNTANDLHQLYELYFSTDATAPTDDTEPTHTSNEASYTFTGLTPETQYSVWVRDNCGDDGYSIWVGPASFTTLELCPTPTDLEAYNITNSTATVSWNGQNDSYNFRYRVAAGLEPIFSEDFSNGIGDWTMQNCDARTGVTNGTFRFYYRSNPPQYLISPEITGINSDAIVEFTYWNHSTTYPETFQVGMSSTTNDVDAFSWSETITAADRIQHTYHATVPAGTKYIAIKLLSDDQYHLYIDDIVIGEPVNAGEWVETSTNETHVDLSELTTETKYDAQVQGVCSSLSMTTEWTNVYTFTTKSVFTKAVEANKWYAISSPMHNMDNDETLEGVNNLTGSSFNYDLYGYDESNGQWRKPEYLARAKGYIYRRSEATTLGFSGDANSGNFSASSISVSCPDLDLKGFALVGNPYKHTIYKGVAFGTSSNFITGWYKLTEEGLWLVQTNDDPINAGEAALVKVSSNWSVTNSFTDNANAPTAKSAHATTLAFTVSNEKYEDKAYAMFSDGEGLTKVSHLAADAPALSIAFDGRRYAIAQIGADAEAFEMNFRGSEGSYTIATDEAELSTFSYIHLIDRATGKDIDLLSNPTYSFTHNGSESVSSRFLVRLSPESSTNASASSFVYWNGSAWVVEGNGTLQVFDVLGRKVFSKEVNTEVTIPTSQFPGAGVYIIRLGEKSQKIVVK